MEIRARAIDARGAADAVPRDYGALVARVCASAAQVSVLGEVAGLPVLYARVGDATTTAPLLLIAGTHGDEPAAVEAAVQLLEGDALGDAGIDVLPCTNPTGFVAGTRETAEGVDINWSWRRHDVPEIELLRGFLAGRRWRSVLDLHEDWESPGFYLYEHRRGVAAAGPRIVDAVAQVCAIHTDAEIEGWPAGAGIVTADSSQERMDRGDGLPLVLLRDHTPHKMTTETPSGLPLATRVRAQRAAVRAWLDHDREL